jgi:hypothetical protein
MSTNPQLEAQREQEAAAESRAKADAAARADAKAKADAAAAAKPDTINKLMEPRFVPMRARLVCTEITNTQRGVTVLTLEVKFDGNIKAEERLATGNSPKGSLSIEVSNDWAGKNAVHGSVFYLISTNQKQ